MPKRVPPLTAIKIAKLKPHPTDIVELVDGAVPGLRLRLLPSGLVSWSLSIRDRKGERRRFEVGQGLGLAEARKRAEDVKRLVHDGADPTAARREVRARAKAAKAGIGTFRSLVASYYENGPGCHLTSAKEQMRRILDVFSEFADKPAVELTPAQLQIAADNHPSASSGARAVAYVKPVAKWAAKRELMRRGFNELEKPIATSDENGGQRVLTEVELEAILPSLGTTGFDAAARLMLWTGARLEEVCSATCGEFDLAQSTWTIPGSRRKDTRSRRRKKQISAPDHVIYLPRQASLMLKELLGEADRLAFRSPKGAKLQNWDRWSKAKITATGVKDWDRHALRRTTATMVGDHGAPPHIVSALLGHRNIGDQLVAGYSKARYERQVGEFLQLVADRLESLEQKQGIEAPVRRVA